MIRQKPQLTVGEKYEIESWLKGQRIIDTGVYRGIARETHLFALDKHEDDSTERRALLKDDGLIQHGLRLSYNLFNSSHMRIVPEYDDQATEILFEIRGQVQHG